MSQARRPPGGGRGEKKRRWNSLRTLAYSTPEPVQPMGVSSLQKAIKQRLDAENISIPFPQRDVHLYKEEG